MSSVSSHAANSHTTTSGARPYGIVSWVRNDIIPRLEQDWKRTRLRQDVAFQLSVFGPNSGRWSGCEHTRQRYRLQRFLDHRNPSVLTVRRIRSMVFKFIEDEVVVDQLLRVANVKPAGNADSILSWHPQDLEIGNPWLVKDQILPPSNFNFPEWYLSASLLEHVKDEDEIKEKIRIMAQAYPRLAIEARRRINDGCFLADGCGTNLQSHFRRETRHRRP